MKIPWWMNLEWRFVKVLFGLCILEFPLTVAALALSGIAHPNTYRTLLWNEGARLGWNSDPILVLYEYANYKTPVIPVPWSQFNTDYNLVMIVLSMFVLLCKCVAYILHWFPPLFSALLHASLATVYGYSISRQLGSDLKDPAHPMYTPWYITGSCGAPISPRLQSSCMQAKAMFAVSCALCGVFFLFFLTSLVSCFPSKAQRAANGSQVMDVESKMQTYDDSQFEMDKFTKQPMTPGKTPMTPRTVAFHTLDGKLGARKPNRELPLRHHIAMGNETYIGKSDFR